MTLREIVYLISDELKLSSDDSLFNEDHIRFLVHKHRASLLNQMYYKDIKKSIPESNYQIINVELQESELEENTYLKSNTSIPESMPFSNYRVYTSDFKNIKITYVSRDRFKFTGYNNWMKNIIYCTNIDGYLYLNNNNKTDLNNIYINSIFEDVEAAYELNNSTCNVLDMEYPLELGLVPLLIQAVVQELSPKTITPTDEVNNATDDKANISNYIARNIKKDAY